MSDQIKPVAEMCKEFKALTGYDIKFSIMHDSAIGMHVDGNEQVKKLAKLFFEKNGYRYSITDLTEYKKRHPKAEVTCDFAVQGDIF